MFVTRVLHGVPAAEWEGMAGRGKSWTALLWLWAALRERGKREPWGDGMGWDQWEGGMGVRRGWNRDDDGMGAMRRWDGTGVMRGWNGSVEGMGQGWWGERVELVPKVPLSQPVAVPSSSRTLSWAPGIWYRLRNRKGCSSTELWTGPDLMHIFRLLFHLSTRLFSLVSSQVFNLWLAHLFIDVYTVRKTITIIVLCKCLVFLLLRLRDVLLLFPRKWLWLDCHLVCSGQ